MTATFQRALYIILSKFRWKTCLVYLDHIILYSDDIECHLKDVKEIVQCLHKAGISLRLKKCNWFSNEVNYLGQMIQTGKLEMEEAQ